MTSELAMQALQRPFPACDIEWRISRSGKKRDGVAWAKVLAYITARAVHERLDEVFSLGGWRNEFRVMEVPGGKNGIVCRIWFRDPETQEWTWKENGADQTDFDPFKGGLSAAEKRTFAELGGGRYLYKLTENWAEISDVKTDACPYYAKLKAEDGGDKFYWGPPQLPPWALPPGTSESPSPDADAASDEPEASPFADDVYMEAYPNVSLPPPGTKGINDAKAVLGHAQKLCWSEADFVAWQTSVVNKDFSQITAAQATFLLKKIKEEE